MNGVRLDKWLWAARFFKTRTLAAKACELGRIVANHQPARSAREVRIGDRLSIRNEGGTSTSRFLRSATLAGRRLLRSNSIGKPKPAAKRANYLRKSAGRDCTLRPLPLAAPPSAIAAASSAFVTTATNHGEWIPGPQWSVPAWRFLAAWGRLADRFGVQKKIMAEHEAQNCASCPAPG